jgi:hypothetical protein
MAEELNNLRKHMSHCVKSRDHIDSKSEKEFLPVVIMPNRFNEYGV